MASVYDLKPRFQGLLRPLVRRLQSRGVSANQVTLAALLLSLLVAGVVALTAADPDASRGWFLLIAIGAVGLRTRPADILKVGRPAAALLLAETLFLAGLVALALTVLPDFLT